jgi:DNA invertase Pin-like site-specific DNA recombinase
MLTRPVSQKIRPDHLDRLAVIYVRQSTLFQVRENTGSTTRQYDLVKRAQDLGWTPEAIQVVDQDQGQSGSSSIGRDGFQWLVAEVGLGHVGAVLSLEVSRLARSCSDWYRLLEICALSDTLVIDDEGVYDPGAHNDRLLLGFKGSMSEAELHWLKSRLLGGKVAKAEQGALRFRLPIGLLYDPVGRIVLDPDEAVQEAVRLVFSLFEQWNSALAVVSSFAEQHLRFPTRWWGGKRADELIWSRLTHERVLNILHSPLYAGAYVYGRDLRSDDTRFLEKSHASKGEPTGSNRKTGLLCCAMRIQRTSPGNTFCAISVNSTITALGGQKSTEERFEKGRRSCKALSCVARVGDAWAFAISAMAPC